jgi:hypothetical protein
MMRELMDGFMWLKIETAGGQLRRGHWKCRVSCNLENLLTS